MGEFALSIRDKADCKSGGRSIYMLDEEESPQIAFYDYRSTFNMKKLSIGSKFFAASLNI
jgi:hypothetical protein